MIQAPKKSSDKTAAILQKMDVEATDLHAKMTSEKTWWLGVLGGGLEIIPVHSEGIMSANGPLTVILLEATSALSNMPRTPEETPRQANRTVTQ